MVSKWVISYNLLINYFDVACRMAREEKKF